MALIASEVARLNQAARLDRAKKQNTARKVDGFEWAPANLSVSGLNLTRTLFEDLDLPEAERRLKARADELVAGGWMPWIQTYLTETGESLRQYIFCIPNSTTVGGRLWLTWATFKNKGDVNEKETDKGKYFGPPPSGPGLPPVGLFKVWRK